MSTSLVVKVLQSSMIGYNSIARSLTPSRLDFNKSSRFKNTLKTTIDYLNAIGNIISKNQNPDDVKLPLYPVANELADVLLDILDKDVNMKGIEQRNDLILQFIYIKIFILFTEFKYFCDRIKAIKEYKIVEAPQVEGVAKLDTLTAAKDKVDADLIAANAAKDKVKAELATAEEKYKGLDNKKKLLEKNILTIDEAYFKNAFDNAKNLSDNDDYLEAEKILTNINDIWSMLIDDSKIKKNNNIQQIIKDINKLITENEEKYKGALSMSGGGGGKRKKISSRTKRK